LQIGHSFNPNDPDGDVSKVEVQAELMEQILRKILRYSSSINIGIFFYNIMTGYMNIIF